MTGAIPGPALFGTPRADQVFQQVDLALHLLKAAVRDVDRFDKDGFGPAAIARMQGLRRRADKAMRDLDQLIADQSAVPDALAAGFVSREEFRARSEQVSPGTFAPGGAVPSRPDCHVIPPSRR